MLKSNIKKHILKLKQKKFRKEYGEFLVEGVKGVKEALANDVEVLTVIVDGKRREEKGIKEVISQAEKEDIAIEYAGRKDLTTLKSTDTFPGVLAIVEMEDYGIDELVNNDPVICLDRVNDPGNLGTIIRTADWFGISNIILSEGSVDPYNEKTVRSTMGSIFRTNIFSSKNILKTLENLKEKGYKIVILDIEGKDVDKLKPKEKTIYVFGSESHGIDENLKNMSDEVYTIFGKGKAESLNLAISAGILMSKLK